MIFFRGTYKIKSGDAIGYGISLTVLMLVYSDIFLLFHCIQSFLVDLNILVNLHVL